MLLREVEYARPATVDEAVSLLGSFEGARALAGGQTLVNVMKARAAAPDVLVDLADLDELRAIGFSADGLLEIGAMVTYAQLVGSSEVDVARPILAEVAATILRDPAAHAGAAYELTGPEALTMAEIAATVADAQGRAVTYRDETLDEARASRAVLQAPEWQVDAWISTYTAMAAGEMAHVSGDVERVLGRPATSLAAFLAAEG